MELIHIMLKVLWIVLTTLDKAFLTVKLCKVLSEDVEFINNPYSPLRYIFRSLFLAINFQPGDLGHVPYRRQLFLVVGENKLYCLIIKGKKFYLRQQPSFIA